MATSSEIDFMKASNSETLERLLNNILLNNKLKKFEKLLKNFHYEE